MKIYHVDGGAFVEPPNYRFHDAYFSVIKDNGQLVHFEKNIGDMWSGKAEYRAIEWVVKNIAKRPIKITSDCTVAIAWARKGSSIKSKIRVPALDLTDIELEYQHGNLADQWNAVHHSPKKSKGFYYERWLEAKRTAGKEVKLS